MLPKYPDLTPLFTADCGCEITPTNPAVKPSVGGVIWLCSLCGKSWFQEVKVVE